MGRLPNKYKLTKQAREENRWRRERRARERALRQARENAQRRGVTLTLAEEREILASVTVPSRNRRTQRGSWSTKPPAERAKYGL